MQNQGGANMLVTGAIFTGCPTSDVQMNPFGTGNVIHDVTFDNVYFGKTACCNSIALGTQGTDTSICPSLHITLQRLLHDAEPGHLRRQGGCYQR